MPDTHNTWRELNSEMPYKPNPNLAMYVSKEWSPEQIETFEDWFKKTLDGSPPRTFPFVIR